jgi:DNA (cytosine-5)-methyltransferase 3A
MLGNGWTVEVIKHILRGIPEIVGGGAEADVLSMYDGMSCGQIALRELGVKIKRYVSYEIDKYAIAVTQANFPRTEQRGDAFAVRGADWRM